MTSNGKELTVPREMLTAVARDQSVQLKVDVVAGIAARFSKLTFAFIIYQMVGCLMTGPSGNNEF